MANQRHPTKTHLSAWIPKALKNRLRKAAKREDRPVSFILEKFLSAGVRHHEGKARSAAA